VCLQAATTVPRVLGWVRGSDQSACVAMQRGSRVSTVKNKQRKECVSQMVRKEGVSLQ